jgi:hypothetical protein
MKKVLIALLLLMPALVWAEKPAPNPADYTITVHVQSSKLQCSPYTTCPELPRQLLSVLSEGKKYQLQSSGVQFELLRVGDYKAKISFDETKLPYEYMRVYEFLFPDGKTRKFAVVGEEE